MATVTVCGASYACTTAIKGTDYILLLDDSGVRVASFEGVTDFSIFSISGGSWATPKATDDCPIAVVREDGSIGKCGKTTGQFLAGGEPFSKSIILTNGVQYGATLPTSAVEGQLFFKI